MSKWHKHVEYTLLNNLKFEPPNLEDFSISYEFYKLMIFLLPRLVLPTGAKGPPRAAELAPAPALNPFTPVGSWAGAKGGGVGKGY